MTEQAKPLALGRISDIEQQYPTLAKALPRKTKVARIKPGFTFSMDSDKRIYIPFFYMAVWEAYGQLIIDEKRDISKPLSWNLASAFFTDLTKLEKGGYFTAFEGSEKYAPVAFCITNGTFTLYVGQFLGEPSKTVYSNKVKDYKAYLYDSAVIRTTTNDGKVVFDIDTVNRLGDFGHRAGNYMLQYTPFFLKKQYLEASMDANSFTIRKLKTAQTLSATRKSTISHGISDSQFEG